MPATALTDTLTADNPIDLLEHLASGKEWTFDRPNDAEMAIHVPGQWGDYNLFFAWSEDLGALHVSCCFEMRVQDSQRAAVYELLAVLNERLWLGHFALWSDEGLPMFRHTMRVTDLASSERALEELIDIAVGECDRFYPAFNFVIWGGQPVQDAVRSAMLEVMGEA